jgi:maleate isomerase
VGSSGTGVERQLPGLRLGLLVPSSNTVMEVDLYRRLEPGVTVHTARMFLESTTPEAESRMLDEFALPAARDIATVRPHVVIFGCTSAGALRGNTYDAELCARISQVTAVRTISVIASVREGIARVGGHRVAVITPYIESLNQPIKDSLEAVGFEVIAVHGLGITDNLKIAEVSPEQIADFASEKVGSLPMDCLFVSCTNFRAMDALPLLRQRFEVPIVTSNQAALQVAARHLAVTGSTGPATESTLSD